MSTSSPPTQRAARLYTTAAIPAPIPPRRRRLFKEPPCAFPNMNRLPPLLSLHTRHCASSMQECQSGSPKCAWQNQRPHCWQYWVAGIMHGSSQRETPWQNTAPGLLFSWPGVS